MEENDQFILQRIGTLVGDIHRHFPEIGELLYRAQESKKSVYRSALKIIGRRTAYYLLEIHKAFHPLGTDRSRLLSIGWTKCARIAKYVTPHNVDKLLQLAADYNERKLLMILQGQTPVLSVGRVVLLTLQPAEYKLYATVLLKHGALPAGRGLAHQEKALLTALRKLNKE